MSFNFSLTVHTCSILWSRVIGSDIRYFTVYDVDWPTMTWAVQNIEIGQILKHKQHRASFLIYNNTPIESELSHIRHSVITGKARALKVVQLWCSKPTDLLHIWQRCEERRHVHYHLLLSESESTKKLMRGREGELPDLPFHLHIGQTATQTDMMPTVHSQQMDKNTHL